MRAKTTYPHPQACPAYTEFVCTTIHMALPTATNAVGQEGGCFSNTVLKLTGFYQLQICRLEIWHSGLFLFECSE
jgi:hypothetical protein